jgi:hypothetical protein
MKKIVFLIIGIVLIVFVVAIITVSNRKKDIDMPGIKNIKVYQLDAGRMPIKDIFSALGQQPGSRPTIVSLTDADVEDAKYENDEYQLLHTYEHIKVRNFVHEPYGESLVIGGYVDFPFESNSVYLNTNGGNVQGVKYYSNKDVSIIETLYTDFGIHRQYIVFTLNINVDHGNYFNNETAGGVWDAFVFIAKIYKTTTLPFIIVGNFKIQNWDIIRKCVFDDMVWSSGKFQLCTSDSSRYGIAAPSGIIVHKALGSSIEYDIILPVGEKIPGTYVLSALISNVGSGERLTQGTVETINRLKSIDVSKNIINSDIAPINVNEKREIVEFRESVDVEYNYISTGYMSGESTI